MDHSMGLFFKGTPFEITWAVTTTWAIMLALFLVVKLTLRRVEKVPKSGAQHIFEMLFDFLTGWLAGFMGGRKTARRFLPLLATFFMFILISNLSGLLPGAGTVPGFMPPTGRWGTTGGLALVAIIAVQVYGIREKGLWGYLKGLAEPSPIMLPFNILEQIVSPFSLSLRLYGNIFAEEMLLGMIAGMIPMIVPIPIMGLAILFGTIQAVVFTTLASIYIGHAVHVEGHDEPEQGQPGMAGALP